MIEVLLEGNWLDRGCSFSRSWQSFLLKELQETDVYATNKLKRRERTLPDEPGWWAVKFDFFDVPVVVWVISTEAGLVWQIPGAEGQDLLSEVSAPEWIAGPLDETLWTDRTSSSKLGGTENDC